MSGSSIPRLDLKIREVAGAAEAWPNAMKGLRDVLGCGGAGAFVTNKATRCVEWAYFSGLGAETEARFVKHYALIDPFRPLLCESSGWMRLSQCYPRSILRRSEWYNDFVVGTCGAGDIVGARVTETATRSVFIGASQEIGKSFSDKTLSSLSRLTDSLSAVARSHVECLYGVEQEPNGEQSPTSGARYYFHLGNGRIYRDDTGEVFPTRDAALMHATRLATELAEDTAWNNFWITVTDDRARKIARIPVRL